MATIVTFHAHPDDESIITGGVMAKYAAEGHRVVLVLATKGELGEVAEGVLRDGETLSERRMAETAESARILGVACVEYLGYLDSGMMGETTNDDPRSFWQADLEEASGRLARILREEHCDVLVHYDANGGYGHPDHIKVHRVARRAAAMAGVSRSMEATSNRDHFKRGFEAARVAGLIPAEDLPEGDFLDELGVPESEITHTIDVREWIDVKRASMAAHASQIGEASFFLAMPDDVFLDTWGWEWFLLPGAPSGPDNWSTDLLS